MDYMEQATGFLSMWVSNTATAVVMLPIGLSIVMIIAWLVLVTVFKPEMNDIPGGRELIKKELDEMGRMGRGEVMTAVIFLTAALSWVFIPIILKRAGSDLAIADAAIGMAAAMLLFMVPTRLKKGVRLIDWATASKLPRAM